MNADNTMKIIEILRGEREFDVVGEEDFDRGLEYAFEHMNDDSDLGALSRSYIASAIGFMKEMANQNRIKVKMENGEDKPEWAREIEDALKTVRPVEEEEGQVEIDWPITGDIN